MKKMFGLSALAILGAMSMQPVSVTVPHADTQRNLRNDQRNQNRESRPLNVQQYGAKKMTFEASRDYAKLNNRNTGIDPKTYGMQYVKRGTHKRTNV